MQILNINKHLFNIYVVWSLIFPGAKTWFYERLLFEMVIVMVKNKKIQYKIYNINQN